MAPPAVAFFDAYPHLRGGAQRAVAGLASGLVARGRRVVVVVPADGPFPQDLRRSGVEVVVVEAPAPLLVYGRTHRGAAAAAVPRWWVVLARRLGALGVDVVHVGDHRGMVLAAPAARMAGLPVVWHLHATEPGTRLDRMGVALAAAVVVPSRRALEQHPRLEAARLLVEAPYPRWPPRSGAVAPSADPRSAPPNVGTLARLHPSKGLDVLVDALAVVRRSVPDATVVVAGGAQPEAGDVEAQLRAPAAELGVGDGVRLLGHLEDPGALLANAAVYCQPSRPGGELLPLAVIEAAGSGLPVVASDLGSLADVVLDGVTGYLVAEGDVPALAARLVTLLEDRELAATMGRAGAELVATKHRPDDFVELIAGVHDRVTRR